MSQLTSIQPVVFDAALSAIGLPLNCTFDTDDWLKLAKHW